MRRIVLCVVLAAACARPALAQTILYATAAAQNRIDGFAVGPDGAPSADPVAQQPTVGVLPRRLIARGCNLYSAEDDRVEVFRVHKGGRLELIGATRKNAATHAHDIKLSADGRTLYAPIRKMGAIASYPLDAQGIPDDSVITQGGVPAGGPTSCVYGPVGADWEDMAVANGKLYAAYTNRIEIFETIATGQLMGAMAVPHDNNNDGVIDPGETACPAYTTTPSGSIEQCIDPDIRPRPTRPDPSCPFSYRGHMAGAVGLVLAHTTTSGAPPIDTIISSQRFTHLLLGFVLDDTGNFPAYGANPQFPTKKEKKQERQSRKKNKTNEILRYIGLTAQAESDGRPIVYGAAFKGRVDAFKLQADGTLPKDLMSSTPLNVISTPTRTTLGSTAQGRGILYVAAGELDRIQAFRLFDGGAIDAGTSPMETNMQNNSFPNDVVLVDISTCD